MLNPFFRFLFFTGLAAVAMTSCTNTRRLQYMQGSFDTAALSQYVIPEPVIQQNDLLSITVYSDNPAATAIYNQPVGMSGMTPSATTPTASAGASSGSTASSPGYLVDMEGNIQFQGIGTLHVEGLTKEGLKEKLDSTLKNYLTNPRYAIRFLNFKITVIGDVAHPSVYSIPAERVNLLEALGLAGDLTVTARRDNLLVIREQNGKREFGRVDLTRPDIFKSPFFQLRQNDVIYVDLTKNKAAAADQSTLRTITIATSIVSTIAILITVLKR
ncbi:MAG: polysaccharide biosynthesis/export family protein [Bacteroidetes bacterium]|nr:polysaccharide biosynthesis/export family protein [Bacteroidota bacterium]